MSLKKSRNIISVILTIVLAFSLAAGSSVFLIKETFANSAFIDRALITDELAAECEKQLNLQFDALALKSGIPSRVFTNIETDNSVKDTLKYSVSLIFSDESGKVMLENRKEYFYNMCAEYLDGNNIAYNDEDIERTALEAAQIYLGVCTVQNYKQLSVAAEAISQTAPKFSFAAIVTMVICAVLLLFLYSGKNESFGYIGSGISASGIALVFIALLSLITGCGKGILITPQAYYDAYCSALHIFYAFMILLGILEAVAGTVILINVQTASDRKKRRTVNISR